MEVGRGGKIKLPFSPLFFFSSWCRTQSVIFSTQIKQQLARDAWVSAGMLAFGFLRLKIRGGCLPNCCLLWAWSLEERWSFDAAAELGIGAWLRQSVHT